MKFFAILGLFAALFAGALALKNEICGLPSPQEGGLKISCLAAIPSYYYNTETNECVHFIYGGCGGNENRFGSQKACEDKCKE